MTFFKENWFKIALIGFIGYGTVAMTAAYENYPGVQAYQQMRYKTFEKCMDMKAQASDTIDGWTLQKLDCERAAR